MPARKPRLQHAQHALRLIAIALERTLVGDLLAREFMEIADLAEDRPDRGHLKEDPLDGLVAQHRIFRQQLAGLLREIEQDRPGLE